MYAMAKNATQTPDDATKLADIKRQLEKRNARLQQQNGGNSPGIDGGYHYTHSSFPRTFGTRH